MTPRAEWKTWSRVLTLAAIVAACEGSPGAPKTDPTAEPVVAPQPTPDGPMATSEPTSGPKVAQVDGTLDDRSVNSELAGPWTRRRVGAGSGSEAEARPGGMSDGIGMIGKGGGGGSGSGYGRGEGALDSARRSPGAPGDAMVKEASAMPSKNLRRLDDKQAKAGPLKAASTDDNADFPGYLKFLATWTGRHDVEGQFQPMDVAGRAFVQVVDSDGRPVPGARIEVRDAAEGGPVWRATTYGDGRAPYYPRLFGAQQQGPSRLTVRAEAAGQVVEASWDGAKELTLRTAKPQGARPMTLEVLFLIDTTGSMGDEIDQIKTSLLVVTSKAKARRADLVLRYGAVLYRDINDDYLTMAHPFTEDLAAFNGALQGVTAGGGGDLPEAMNQGLERAVEGVEWQPDAAKVVFLICDAPPQMRVKGDVLYGDSALRAVGKGLRIHSVAASGLDPLGTLVLRQVAQLTRGKFIFIEYGGTEATAERHGVGGPVQGGNNLDDILLAQISAEIDGWGRQGS